MRDVTNVQPPDEIDPKSKIVFFFIPILQVTRKYCLIIYTFFSDQILEFYQLL